MNIVRMQKNNAGMTLVEALIYGIMLMVIVNAGAKLSLNAARVSAVNTLAKDRMIAVRNLDADFRDAVRGANGTLQSLGAFNSAENVCILSVSDTQARVAGAVFEKGKFCVLDLELRGGVWEITAMQSAALPLKNISIKHFGPGSGSGLLALEYELAAERGERVRKAMRHSVLAAMRCNAPEGAG